MGRLTRNSIGAKWAKLPLVGVMFLLFCSMAFGQENTFRLAGLKLLPVQWEKAANFRKLAEWAGKAAAAGADLVVTTEGFLEGYVANEKLAEGLTWDRYLEVGEPIDGPWIQKVRELADDLNVYLLLGFAERRRSEMYNAALLVSPSGAIIGHYTKSHAMAEPFNSKGSEFSVFSTPLGRLGILICFDRQLPETSRILAIKGAQVILIPAFGLGTSEINEDIMMRTRAYENGIFVAHVHPKNTFIVNPEGDIIAQSRGEDEDIVMAQITLDERVGKGPIRYRRPEVYGEILKKQ